MNVVEYIAMYGWLQWAVKKDPQTRFLPQAEAYDLAKMQEHMNKCDVNTHAQAQKKPKKRTHILGDASPQWPPGFPAGPNIAEAALRWRMSTGQELPTGLAPTQMCI